MSRGVCRCKRANLRWTGEAALDPRAKTRSEDIHRDWESKEFPRSSPQSSTYRARSHPHPPPAAVPDAPMRSLLLLLLVAVAAAVWYFLPESLPTPQPRDAADRVPRHTTDPRERRDPTALAPMQREVAEVAPADVTAPVRVEVEGAANVAPMPASAPAETAEVGPALLTLHIRAVDALGKGVYDAEVNVRRFPPEPATAVAGAGAPLDEKQAGRTDGTGEATFGFSGGGTFLVGAYAEDAAVQERLMLDVGDHSVELQLEPVTTLRGVVRDTHTLAPIDGAELALFPAYMTGRGQFVSDDQGRFAFKSVPGAQTLSARAPGYSGATLVVYIRDRDHWSLGMEGEVRSADAPLEVSLSRERSIQGRVVDLSGTPIRDALVAARGNTMIDTGRWSPDRASARSDSEGRFVLTGLRADVTHILWASHPTHSAVAAVVEAGAPDRDVGTMQLGHPTSLRGRAQWTHADGTTSPAVATRIYLVCSAALSWDELGMRIRVPFELETETDQDGAFLFENAPLGRAQLRGGRSDRWLPLQLENDHTELDEPLVLQAP